MLSRITVTVPIYAIIRRTDNQLQERKIHRAKLIYWRKIIVTYYTPPLPYYRPDMTCDLIFPELAFKTQTVTVVMRKEKLSNNFKD